MKTVDVVDINLDTAEMVIEASHGGKQVVKYEDIAKLEYKDVTVKKWYLISSQVKIIEIYIKGKDQTFYVRSDTFKSPFDSTALHLRKFAEKNKILIVS